MILSFLSLRGVNSKFDTTNIKSLVQEVVDKWDYSGYFTLLSQGRRLVNEYYGFENKDKSSKTTKDTRYLVDSQHSFFARFSILMEVSRKSIKLNEKIAKYIPELRHSDKITIKNLLKGESGLFDYYHSHLMVQFETDDELKALPEYDRVRKEHSIRYENRNFHKVLRIINDKELEFEPGKDDEHSSTESIILNELLTRVTGLTPFEYLKENIFDSLGMDSVQYGSTIETLSYIEHKDTEHVSTPVDFDVEGIFSINNDDLEKLMTALLNKQFLSEAVWKTALKRNHHGNGILFGSSRGFYSTGFGFLGYVVSLYLDFNKKVAYSCVSNEQPLIELVDNNWNYYQKEFSSVVAAIMTFPENTKMVKLDKKNFWSALDISIKPEQNKFVLNAKSSVAMGLFYKEQKVYVQMEGDIVVGLLVLEIDKKKENYYINVVIIDKKFQNKGFGKLMVKWAVEKLKEEGATSLKIGVNRENIAAKKVYMNAGFEPKSVYGGGMELEMKL